MTDDPFIQAMTRISAVLSKPTFGDQTAVLQEALMFMCTAALNHSALKQAHDLEKQAHNITWQQKARVLEDRKVLALAVKTGLQGFRDLQADFNFTFNCDDLCRLLEDALKKHGGDHGNAQVEG